MIKIDGNLLIFVKISSLIESITKLGLPENVTLNFRLVSASVVRSTFKAFSKNKL
jgi:hypothetical protein